MKFFRIDILPKLGDLIKKKNLTEVLECLEVLGYSGDSSIALLTYLQIEGVEA